jgi:hypothetical protein
VKQVSTLQQERWLAHIGRPGVENHQAKLDAATVRRIRVHYRNGANDAYLASIYGVSRGTIFDAGTGRTWRHLAD